MFTHVCEKTLFFVFFPHCAVVPSEVIFVQCLVDDTNELPPYAVLIELLQPHVRSIMFGGEPPTALAHLWVSQVARVASRHFLSRAVVLPKSVLAESLRQLHIYEPPVRFIAEGYG